MHTAAKLGAPSWSPTPPHIATPHYHEPTDTPDKVNYDILARVTVGLEAVVRVLASGMK